MKKKFLSMVVVILCMAVSPATVQAFDSIEANAQREATSGVDGKNVIPVYGYIGNETTIVDPNPENPDVAPETEIYVEVPVKVLFMAFAGEGGIVSPQYEIKNLSTVTDICVDVKSFTQRNQEKVDVAENLKLYLLEEGGTPPGVPLYPEGGAPTQNVKERLEKASSSGENSFLFEIAGKWNGPYTKELNPIFDMTLLFSVAK